MKRHELIAIIAGAPDLSDQIGFRAVEVGGYAVILSTRARPVMALPVSQRAALESAAARQALLERLQALGTVLVARADQWVTRDQAANLIPVNATLLGDLVDWLAGKVQFQVNVSWDPAQVLTRFRDARELAPLFSADRTTPEGLRRALDQLRDRLAGEIAQRLAPGAGDLIALPRGENMLSNHVALIDATAELDLDRAVETVEAIWPEGLLIRQIGPSPAGSFALLDLNWVSPDEVQAARAALGLESGATGATRRAARNAALKRPGADVAAIRRAARIIDAATHLGAQRGLHLVEVLSEDRGLSEQQPKAVA